MGLVWSLVYIQFSSKRNVGRHTSITNQKCLVFILGEAFCMVHHAWAATYITEDEDGDGAEDGFLAVRGRGEEMGCYIDEYRYCY